MTIASPFPLFQQAEEMQRKSPSPARNSVAARAFCGLRNSGPLWLALPAIFLMSFGLEPLTATEVANAASPKSDAASDSPGAGETQETGASAGVESKEEDDRNSIARIAARRKGDITFDDLKFEIERGGKFNRSMLSKEIEAFDKQTLRIRGYILPASVVKQAGIEEFVLVRDNQECCFGPQAMLYDCIMVQMEPGKTTEFSTRPIAVKGKFEVKEFTYPDSDEHYAIFRIVASEAK